MVDKRCSTCRRVLPLDEFGVRDRSEDGRQAACRDCSRARNRDYYARKKAGKVKSREAKLLSSDGRRKECATCHLALPPEAFAKSSNRMDGLYPSCKNCANALRAASYRRRTAGKVTRKPLRTFSDDGTKRWCARCSRFVDVELFHRDKSKPGGISSTCRQCTKEQKRAAYLKKTEGQVNRRRRAVRSEDGKQKTCLDCSQMLSLSEFHPNGASADGVGSLCRECTSKSNTSAYWRDPERAKQRAARNRQSRPEETKARRRDWYYRNRERANETHQRWTEENPGKRKEYHSRRRARQAAAVPQRWVRRECPDYLCYWCGRRTFDWVKATDPRKRVLEHLMPISLGGPAEPSNEAQACNACNQSKSDKHPLVWIALLVSDAAN